ERHSRQEKQGCHDTETATSYSLQHGGIPPHSFRGPDNATKAASRLWELPLPPAPTRNFICLDTPAAASPPFARAVPVQAMRCGVFFLAGAAVDLRITSSVESTIFSGFVTSPRIRSNSRLPASMPISYWCTRTVVRAGVM